MTYNEFLTLRQELNRAKLFRNDVIKGSALYKLREFARQDPKKYKEYRERQRNRGKGAKDEL